MKRIVILALTITPLFAMEQQNSSPQQSQSNDNDYQRRLKELLDVDREVERRIYDMQLKQKEQKGEKQIKELQERVEQIRRFRLLQRVAAQQKSRDNKSDTI